MIDDVIVLFFPFFQDVISSYGLLLLFVEEILIINSLELQRKYVGTTKIPWIEEFDKNFYLLLNNSQILMNFKKCIVRRIGKTKRKY